MVVARLQLNSGVRWHLLDSIMDSNALGLALATRYRTYWEAIQDINRHVEDSTARYSEQAAETAMLRRNLAAARAATGLQISFEDGREVSLNPEEAELLIEALDTLEGSSSALPELILEMAFVYACALWDALYVDAIAHVMVSTPEALASSKRQMSYETILGARSWDALVRTIIQREVNELGYKSVVEQIDFVSEKLGATIEKPKIDTDTLTEIHARRNLFVHNSGIVNSIYTSLVPVSEFAIGTKAVITAAYWDVATEQLNTAALALISALLKKFVGDFTPEIRDEMFPMSRRRQYAT